jgi:hypothetical protein
MPELIEHVDYIKVADEDKWRDRLVRAQEDLRKRTIPAFIEFCREVHAFRLDCDASQGGSEFQRKGCEWLGVTPATLHAWCSVGRRADELSGAPESLPPSEDSLCRIASLDDIAFRKALPQLSADMTQQDVRALVKEVKPVIQPTEEEVEDRWRKKRMQLYKAFESLPPKHRYVLAEMITSFQAREERE